MDRVTICDVRGFEHKINPDNIKTVVPGKVLLTDGSFIRIDERPIVAQAILIALGRDVVTIQDLIKPEETV